MLCSVYDRTLVVASMGGAFMHSDSGIILWFSKREACTALRACLRLASGIIASVLCCRPIHRDSQALDEASLFERFA